jgi:hypothetical protein
MFMDHAECERTPTPVFSWRSSKGSSESGQSKTLASNNIMKTAGIVRSTLYNR